MRASKARTAPRIVQPRRLPSEVPWDPPFIYECTRGHRIQANVECCSCPACPEGVPCDAELRRVGPHGGAVRS